MSIGESLADARRQAGLTISQVSQQTRIRESIIRDIEQGDFSTCGGDFYARGHIRSIAGAVGADPAPLISEYDADHGPLHPLRAAEVFEHSKPIKIRERRSPSLALIVVVVLLAVIGFAAYRLVSSHNNKGNNLAGTAATSSTTPSAHPTPKATASPTPSATPSQLVIKVTATEDCWISLTKASDGSQLYMGVVSAGSSMTWTEKSAVQMVLGNPGGVVLMVNGHEKHPNPNTVAYLSFSLPSGSQSG
ncbi:MAG TPA: RodZ domain-containing protein [Streptosporangiaceae bacterium]|nr:RodZ domain-containing protein [Streptosporangiaceae bacterium]